MSRIALTAGDVRLTEARRTYVPMATVVIACLLSALPIVTAAPVLPDFAFMALIAWRLLRPEIWTARTALALGLFNDLVGGHPIGQSMALWTAAFLLLDLIDSRTIYRDYWLDWLFASILLIFHTVGDWYIGYLMGNRIDFTVMTPQMVFALLTYPAVARLIIALDRWRLRQ